MGCGCSKKKNRVSNRVRKSGYRRRNVTRKKMPLVKIGGRTGTKNVKVPKKD